MRGPTATQKRFVAGLANPLLRLASLLFRRLAGVQPMRLPDELDPAAAAKVERVLAVRLDAIGDLLLTEPALALLRQRFPNARIDLAANPASAQVLQDSPNFDRLIPYRAPWHAAWRGANVDWRSELSTFREQTAALRQERYDVGVELRGDIRDIIFLVTAAPRAVIGNSFRGGKGLLDWDIPLPADGHQVALSATIASLGQPPQPIPAPRVVLTDADRTRAASFVSEDGLPMIALHLGAGFASKCLPVGHFIQVCTSLWKQEPQRRFLIVGSADEAHLAQAFTAAAPFQALDLTGKLSLLETAAVLARCRLFIGNDSAPMHLAAAVGTPVVTFFGPSEPWKFHPYGAPYKLLEVALDCRPCDYIHCIWPESLRFQCMTAQSVEDIQAAAEVLLAQPVPARPV